MRLELRLPRLLISCWTLDCSWPAIIPMMSQSESLTPIILPELSPTRLDWSYIHRSWHLPHDSVIIPHLQSSSGNVAAAQSDCVIRGVDDHVYKDALLPSVNASDASLRLTDGVKIPLSRMRCLNIREIDGISTFYAQVAAVKVLSGCRQCEQLWFVWSWFWAGLARLLREMSCWFRLTLATGKGWNGVSFSPWGNNSQWYWNPAPVRKILLPPMPQIRASIHKVSQGLPVG